MVRWLLTLDDVEQNKFQKYNKLCQSLYTRLIWRNLIQQKLYLSNQILKTYQG